MPRTKELRPIEGHGSMLTWQGTNQCLGHLMHFAGHGVYEPNVGRVDVTKADADAHNAALDKALIDGLDQNCQVGQGGSFYLGKQYGKYKITTFTGLVVSEDVTVAGRSVTFRRAGKTFRGRSSTKHDLFNFRRVT